MRARLPEIERLIIDDHGQGQTASNCLGNEDDIRNDPGLFEGIERTGTPNARLDLVDDERNPEITRHLANAA
jgi:hypothetical protein